MQQFFFLSKLLQTDFIKMITDQIFEQLEIQDFTLSASACADCAPSRHRSCRLQYNIECFLHSTKNTTIISYRLQLLGHPHYSITISLRSSHCFTTITITHAPHHQIKHHLIHPCLSALPFRYVQPPRTSICFLHISDQPILLLNPFLYFLVPPPRLLPFRPLSRQCTKYLLDNFPVI